jgi:hypothetical protein
MRQAGGLWQWCVPKFAEHKQDWLAPGGLAGALFADRCAVPICPAYGRRQPTSRCGLWRGRVGSPQSKLAQVGL